MANEPTRRQELTPQEIGEEEVVDLPDREAMSLLQLGIEDIGNINFAMPINEATAVNNYSNYSVAMADADQVVVVDQGLEDNDTGATDNDDNSNDNDDDNRRGGRR
jgi:hypothetical protein